MIDYKEVEKIINDYDNQIELLQQEEVRLYGKLAINYNEQEEEEEYHYSFDD